MQPSAAQVRRVIRAAANPDRVCLTRSFFKTGPGEYGAGDHFLGLTVPQQRRIARAFRALPMREIEDLLASPWHEERFVALVILVYQFSRGTPAVRVRIIQRYRAAIARSVNNWDLVDATAYKLLGEYCTETPRGVRTLATLARSSNLWERRVAMIATLAYTVRGQYAPTFRIARMLLRDPHDLMHKATGWMLREVGKRDQRVLERFLRMHAHHMPRTMLRYAVERFAPFKRAMYLAR